MNEEAILDSYNLFVSKGYNKSIDEFKNLIRTNPEALNDSFSLFASKGYNKGLNEYKDLMGITAQPTETAKQVQPEAAKEVQPKPAIKMGQPQKGIQPIPIVDPFKKKSSTVSSVEDGSLVSPTKYPKFVEDQITQITPELIGKDEEYVVPQLEYQFGPLGFKFEEILAGDYMSVTAPNGKKINITLDPLLSSKEIAESKKLKSFIAENTATIPSLSKFEKEYSQANKKYSTQKEVDESISIYNKEEDQFRTNATALVKKIDNFYAEKEALENAPTSVRNTPEFQKRVQNFNQQSKLIQSESQQMLDAEADLKLRSSKLNQAVGKYTTMKAEQGGWLGGLGNRFYKGFGRIGSTLASSVTDLIQEALPAEFTMGPDLYKNTVIKKAQDNGIQLSTSQINSLKSEAAFKSWYNSIDDDLKDKIENQVEDEAKKIVKYGEKDEATGGRKDGILDPIRKGLLTVIGDDSTTAEWDELKSQGFWSGAVLGTAESIPAMMGGFAQRTALMYASVSDNLNEEMSKNPEFDNISEREKLLITVPIGIAVASLESIGIRNVIANKGLLNGLVMKALGKSGASTTAKTFGELVKNEVKSGIARGALTLAGGTLAEAETGAAQQIVEVGLKEIYNEVQGKNMFETPESFSEFVKDVAIAGGQEAVGGFIIGTLPAAAAAYRKQGFKGMSDQEFTLFEIAANDTKIEKAFVASLKNDVNLGAMTMEQAKETLNDYRNSVGLFNSLPDNLDIKGKKEAMNLLKEKRDLERQIDGKDDALVVPQKTRIKAINDELIAISERPAETEVVPDETSELAQQRVDRIAELEDLLNPETASLYPIDQKEKLETELETLKTEQDAIQEQAAGQVPVQSETVVSETMEEGKPTTEPKGVAEEGQQIQALTDVDSTAEALEEIEKENPITIEETEVGGKLTGGILDAKEKAIEGDKRGDVKTPSILNFLPRVLELVHLARSKKDKGKVISGGFNSSSVSIDSPIPGIYFSSEDWSTMGRFNRSKEDSIYTTIENDGLLYFDSPKGLKDFLKENNLPSEGQTLNAEQITALKDMGVKGILLRQDFASQSRNELIVIDKSIIKNVSGKPINEITKLPSSFSNPKDIAEAYHQAKANGSNPKLVESVENLLAPKNKQVVQGKPAVTPTVQELLTVDTKDETNLQNVYNLLDQLDNDISKRLKGGANEVMLAIPLLTAKAIIKTVKALVSAGMSLQDAIKQAAADNNVTENDVIDSINLINQQTNVEEKNAKFETNETIRSKPTGDRTGRTESSAIAPLEGAPTIQGVNGPDPQLVAVADQYAKDNGIPFKRQAEYVKVDEERASRIADAYEEMINDPQNPKVKEAYQDLIKQTTAQYQALVDAGYKFWFMDLNIPSNLEYASTPYNAIRDMRNNKQMGVFPTTDGYGESEISESDIENNPLLADTGIQWPVGGIDGQMKPVLANDLFRAVHDAFGHGLEGAGFRARGEENAWQAHVRLFTGPAVGAITSETRGQNSWLNYGPNGETNRTAKIEDTIFAEQKVGLMPEWTWSEGRSADMEVGKADQAIGDLMTADTKNVTVLENVLGLLNKADDDISKRLKTGGFDASLALPLMAIKAIIKSVKLLVKAGMSLQEAIKQAAADNNVTEKDVVASIQYLAEQRDIEAKPQGVSEMELPGYNQMMSNLNDVIERSKRRGANETRVMENAIAYLQGSKVYQEASDTQREQMVRDVRKMFGKKEKSAPKPAKLFGEIKDVKMITMSEYDLLMKQLSDEARTAKNTKTLWMRTSAELTKYIKKMQKNGHITIKQASAVLRKFSNVNMFNDASINSFVNYMQKVFNDANYADQIAKVRASLKVAKKNIQTKLGTAQTLYPLLSRMLAINPTLIPDAVFDRYVEIVTAMGERKAVLTLEESGQLTDAVEDILAAVNEEVSKSEELAELFDLYADKIVDANGKVSFANTVLAMVEDGSITEKDAELMRKYKSKIMPPTPATPKSEAEIQAEKDLLIIAIQDIATIDVDGLPMKDERDKARELERLIQTNAVGKLDNAQLINLLRVIENINNGYFPHYAELVIERLNAKNESVNLDNAIQEAKPLPVTSAYARLKKIFTKKDAFTEMIRSTPLFFIGQVFGDFKTKAIFNAIFEKAAEAQSMFKRSINELNNKLDNAEEAVAKSFNLNGNDLTMSKYKMMTFMLQLEYESNPDTNKVNQASEYLKKTISHILKGKSNFTKRDVDMLQEILKDYSDANGSIDSKKLYDSFNSAEKNAIKVIQEINSGLREKAIFTAAVIRGDKIHPLDNYIHHNVLHDYKPEESISGAAFIDQYNQSLRPSTKAKSLIERKVGITPLNFDVFASANRGAKFTLMDYYLTEPIRTARKTLNETDALMNQKIEERDERQKQNPLSKKEKEKQDKSDQTKRDIFNAIDNAFEEAVDNLLSNNFTSSSFGDQVATFMSKQGYRAVLASLPRFAAELSSNVAFAMIAAPQDFKAGVGLRGIVFSADASTIMNNLKSKQTNRIFPNDTLSGRLIDSSIMSQAVGVKGSRANTDVANKIQQIYNLSLKKYQNVVEVMADSLISTPDKMVMRPMWFGAFSNEFKKLTGKEIDFDKVAANDEMYMSENKEALDAARNTADEKTVLTGAADNAFMGRLKGSSKPNQTAMLRFFNMFNNFMSTFLVYEYNTARTGVMAAMGNGSISRKQGVALLAAVTTRMTLYTLLSTTLSNALVGMFVGNDDDDDEKSLIQKFGQSLASGLTSLVLGRDFGNATKAVINTGVEYVNENFLDFLREGEYDPYKDAIQYTIMPPERKGKPAAFADMLINMFGPFGPSIKTMEFAFRKLMEPDKKEQKAIERSEKEKSIRLPLEILGNLGMIPLYKDVRKIVNKQLYKDLEKAEVATPATKKMSKEDMKTYFPNMYNDLYGPGGSLYDIELIKKEIRKEKEKLRKEIKDDMYIP